MQIVTDENVKTVLEFMEANIPAERLIGVTDALPQMARLLWDHLPQEPVCPMRLSVTKPMSDQESQLHSTAI